ncbi:MAG: hypothetical protein ACYC54_12390 [Sedimentisphaerales bacterium]
MKKHIFRALSAVVFLTLVLLSPLAQADPNYINFMSGATFQMGDSLNEGESDEFPVHTDVDTSGTVNFVDFAIIASQWFMGNPYLADLVFEN